MSEALTLTLTATTAQKLRQLAAKRGSGTEGDIVAEALDSWFALDLLSNDEAEKLAASVAQSLATPSRSSLTAARERLLARYTRLSGEPVSG